MKTYNFVIKGMVCESCEKIIKKELLKKEDISDIKINFKTGKCIINLKEHSTLTFRDISKIIESQGYTCSEKNNNLGWIFGALGLIIVGYFLLKFIGGVNIPDITKNMSYSLLFLVGLLTGFHCIAMCGGFVLSYTTKNAQMDKKNHLSHIFYGSGKLISYTLIGALFGLIGSLITFTPLIRGTAGIIAGLFLLIFGLKMLNIIPSLNWFSIKTPRFVSRFVGKETKHHSNPLIIGLLNGLMIACGPLQAFYIMAAGTGSALEGAKILFRFGLGTLPVMLGFGYLAAIFSAKMTHKILRFSGLIVIVLGIIMLNNGLNLSGINLKVGTDNEISNMPLFKDGYQEIRMDVTKNGWEPDSFILQSGVPVKWIINGKELTNCNRAIQVPELNLEFNIKEGEQVIEFIPIKTGTIRWSCWMGMIQGTFIVKENLKEEI